DITQGFDPMFDHGVSQGVGHQQVILWRLEDPFAGPFDGFDDTCVGCHADHRRLGLAGHIHHGQGTWAHGRADDDVNVVVGDELAHVANSSGGVCAVVQDD